MYLLCDYHEPCTCRDLTKPTSFNEGLVKSDRDLVASPHVGAALDTHDVEMQGAVSRPRDAKAGAPLPLSVGVLDAIRSITAVDKEKAGTGKSSIMRWLDDHASSHDASAGLSLANGRSATPNEVGTAALLGGNADGSAPVNSGAVSKNNSRRLDDVGCLGSLGAALRGKKAKLSGVTYFKMPPSVTPSTAPSTMGGSTRITIASGYRRGPTLGEGLPPGDASNPSKVVGDLLHPEEQGSSQMLVATKSMRNTRDTQDSAPQGIQYSNVIINDSRRSTGDVTLPPMPSGIVKGPHNMQLSSMGLGYLAPEPAGPAAGGNLSGAGSTPIETPFTHLQPNNIPGQGADSLL
eukprot:gene5055-34849_t